MSDSLVSVVMPMRNAARFVRASVESVLAQRGVDLELIVVDDGSTDGSADIVRQRDDPRIRIIAGRQCGIAAAFNVGLAAARGAYLARCDADDFYRPGRLQRQVEWLSSHPQHVAVAAGYAYLDARGRFAVAWIEDDGKHDITHELLGGGGRSHMCAYLFRTDVVRSLGGCREWFVTSEDADLQYRLAEVGSIGYEPFDAYGYRLHPASITHTQKLADKQWFAAAAKHFAQQRRERGQDDLMLGAPPVLNAPLPGFSFDRRASSLGDWIITGSWRQQRAGRRAEARRTAWRGVRLLPADTRLWRNAMMLLLKGTAR